MALPRMAWRKYTQNVFAVIEFVMIFLVIAFLLATPVPGLLRVRKHSQALKIPGEFRTADPALEPIATSKPLVGGFEF
jgi:ABC-type Na+ efflux pump permease subunit